MIKKRYINYIMAVICALVICCAVFLGQLTVSTAFAASPTSFSDRNVLDDLCGSTVKGKPFEITDYPYNEHKDIEVINFVEYCYAYKDSLRTEYALYVYVYNPQGLELSQSSTSNKIQMAVAYNDEGEPSDWEKFELEYCNKSTGSDYYNLFYKFVIKDKRINGTYIKDRVKHE